jgi:hypothetical protein
MMLARSASVFARAAASSVSRRAFTSTSLTPLAQTPLLKTHDSPSQKSGILESVLYGSKESKEEEKATHSKVLARGKYVHELQSKFSFNVCGEG